MTTARSKWAVIAGLVITAIAVIAALSFHDHQPKATSLRAPDTAMPKIPRADQVTDMSAQMNGTRRHLPVTDRFRVPKEFHTEVCSYFLGQTRRWNPESKRTMDRFKVGEVHFELHGGGHLDLAIYTAGKGAIEYSVGDDFYVAHYDMDDGAYALREVLEKARQAVGAKAKEERGKRGHSE